MTTAPAPIRIGRPPQLPLRVRRARLLARIGWYAVGWILFGGASYYLVLGDTALWVELMVPVAAICNPFRPRPRIRAAGNTSPRSAS